ncbi:hypothetical protein [Parasitella parasitica]|uniref:RGS domain-containing protein n=1 Tax=Parasitella parasitica TaxID=35722 RepID=A0A0B7NEP4_9FUNG|nr:hypothetical protein [Parasitella parasitica]
MVFSDIAQKALNGFYLSSSTTKNDMPIMAPEGLTLEMVLLDQTSPPFSLKDFSEYLKSTYCNENLLFYEAVTDYKDYCATYFGVHFDESTLLSSKPTPAILSNNRVFDFSTNTNHVLTSEEQLWFDTLIQKFEAILKEFVLSNAPQEINIHYEVRHQLLQSYQTQRLYHPALLFPACSAVVELLRISAFIPFATDPTRLCCPTKKKSIRKRRKSSPKIATSVDSYMNSPPPTPILPSMPFNLSSPISSPTEITTSAPVGFLKRITANFKIRYSSSSPPSPNEVIAQPLPLPLQSPMQQSNGRQVNSPPFSSPRMSSSFEFTLPRIIKSSTSTSSVTSNRTTSSNVDGLYHHQYDTFSQHLNSSNGKKLLPAAAVNNNNHKF